MATATAEKTPIIKDLSKLEDPKVRDALMAVQKLGTTMIKDRLAVDRATAARDKTWTSIQEHLTELGQDVAFEDSGVKLTFTPAKLETVHTPDADKIATVAPELVAQKAELVAQLLAVEEKITALGKEHFTTSTQFTKMKLNLKPIVAKKK